MNIVCLLLECRGTSTGLAHSGNMRKLYQRYRDQYTGCTYVDGNVELVFLHGRNYDLSFLKVLLVILNVVA